MAREPIPVDRLVSELSAALHQQIERARSIARLPADTLLRRPPSGGWNALEVFEHMNLSSGIYRRGLERAFARPGPATGRGATFRPGRIGEFATQAMRPRPGGRIAWRMRTLKLFDPARQHGATDESITRFIALCEGFLRLLEQAPGKDLEALRVTSSLGPVIRFKAGDAFRFPIAHQERHFLQIERLLAA